MQEVLYWLKIKMMMLLLRHRAPLNVNHWRVPLNTCTMYVHCNLIMTVQACGCCDNAQGACLRCADCSNAAVDDVTVTAAVGAARGAELHHAPPGLRLLLQASLLYEQLPLNFTSQKRIV